MSWVNMGCAFNSNPNVSSFSENILSCLHDFYLAKKFCDVWLENKESKFMVHKLILVAHSSYFRNLFESDQLCTSVSISDDISKNSLEILISYMYTGLVIISDVTEARLLLKTAASIELSSVIAILNNYLANHDKKTEEQEYNENISQRNLRPIESQKYNKSNKINFNNIPKPATIRPKSIFSNQKSNAKSDKPLVIPKKLFETCNQNETFNNVQTINSQKKFSNSNNNVKIEVITNDSQKNSLEYDNKTDKFPVITFSFLLSKGKQFKCTICKNGFKYRCGLHHHVKSKHANFYRISNHDALRCKLRRSRFQYFKYFLVDIDDVSSIFSCRSCKLKFSKKSSCLHHITTNHLKNKTLHFNFTKLRFKEIKRIKIPENLTTSTNVNNTIDNTFSQNIFNDGNNDYDCDDDNNDDVIGDVNVNDDKVNDSDLTDSYDMANVKSEKPPISHENLVKRQKTNTLLNNYNCEYCSEVKSLNEWQLRMHMKNVHPNVLHKCTLCEYETRVQQTLNNHLARKHENRKLCTECGKVCCSRFSLKQHMLVKHGIRKAGNDKELHHCPEPNCTYANFIKKRVEDHQVRHKDTRDYTCDKCNKTYKREDGLKKHKSLIHENIRPYVCEVCGHAFGRDTDLKHHLLKHNPDKPYSCNFCSYATQFKSNLQCHISRVHHHVTGRPNIPMLECNECSYKTHRRYRLNEHIKLSHKKLIDIPCNMCDKMFASNTHLYRHVTACHKPKSFQCSHCSYSTSLSHALKDHIRVRHTHKDVKNYVCPLCNYRGATKGNCRKHIKQVHKNLKLEPTYDAEEESSCTDENDNSNPEEKTSDLK